VGLFRTELLEDIWGQSAPSEQNYRARKACQALQDRLLENTWNSQPLQDRIFRQQMEHQPLQERIIIKKDGKKVSLFRIELSEDRWAIAEDYST
jgi:hypothetical protein